MQRLSEHENEMAKPLARLGVRDGRHASAWCSRWKARVGDGGLTRGVVLSLSPSPVPHHVPT
jgi:hypothetical protein